MKLLRMEGNFFGPRPAFREVDLYRAIWVLAERQTDRKTLARKLQLGEGSARGVLRELVRAGLAEIRKRGAILSGNGRAYVDELGKVVARTGKIEKSDLTFQQTAFA